MSTNLATRIAGTDTPASFAEAVAAAVRLLRAGEVVALPTETVYGLAANALEPDSVARIYALKGRPAHNPIIVHVASEEMARRCVRAWPPAAQQLGRAFWPGPLTIVLPRNPSIPDLVTAGGDTVGVRWPSHPFIQAVIRACDFPLAAPSANPSNYVSPTNAAHVAGYFFGKVSLIVDGGQSQVGIESTVVDASTSPVRILRPGMIHAEALRATLREVAGPRTAPRLADAPLRSPGQLRRHYSPRARLLVANWRDDQHLLAVAHQACPDLSALHILAHTRIPAAGNYGRVAVIPHDAEAFARALYAEMHRCDALNAKCIIVEQPPPGPEWTAIADRLQRASEAA
jgi:L-threonylcarbamoyladenylate synthase